MELEKDSLGCPYGMGLGGPVGRFARAVNGVVSFLPLWAIKFGFVLSDFGL